MISRLIETKLKEDPLGEGEKARFVNRQSLHYIIKYTDLLIKVEYLLFLMWLTSACSFY